MRAGADALGISFPDGQNLTGGKTGAALAASPMLEAVRAASGHASADVYARPHGGEGGARGRGRLGSAMRVPVRVVGSLGLDPSRGARGVLPVVAARVAMPESACTLDLTPFIAAIDPESARAFQDPTIITRELPDGIVRARAYSLIARAEMRRLLVRPMPKM